MVTALRALGVAHDNIRSWDTRRSSYAPTLLLEERPHWLFINKPWLMKDQRRSQECRDHGRRMRRLLAALIEVQTKHGGQFAMYGNPLWWTWDADKAPEFRKVYEKYYLTELRWCNMGIKDPQRARASGRRRRS